MKALQARLHSPSSTCLHRLENAMNLQKFPRYPLTFGPSPITPLPRLSAHLGGKVHLYPSARTATRPGLWRQQETRKMEYLIPEAIAGGYDTLVSIGGIQSNQTRQVAAVAAHLGMKCDAGAGELGELLRRGVRPRGQHRDEPSWAPICAWTLFWALTSASAPAGEQAMDDVKKAGGNPSRFPRAVPSTHTVAWGGVGFAVRQQTECASRKRTGLSSSTTSSCARSRQHAGGHGGGLCGRRPPAR